MVRTIHWDLTGVITQVKRDRQYVVLVDGSRRLTTRNRRHLRRIPDPVDIDEPRNEAEKVRVEEEDKEEHDTPAPASVLAPSLATNPILYPV